VKKEKKEEENLKLLKVLCNKDEQIINNMKMVNKERKKQINELEIALSNKEPKLKPLLKEKSQKEIEEENALHTKKYNYNFQQINNNYKNLENNIEHQKLSRELFKKLEDERGDYYNIRKVNYYLSNMQYVQDHLRPSINITVPANHEDCYNFDEYMMWLIMYDVMRRHGEQMINNPHVDKNDQLKIHPKS
jgi:hypothetical protein